MDNFDERPTVLAARVRYLQAQLDLHRLIIHRIQNWNIAVSTVATLAAMTAISALVIATGAQQ